jgi:diguanylate cyclase
MNSLAYIAPWVFASMSVGVVVGVILGRGRANATARDSTPPDTQAALKMLAEVLGAAEHIASNVESHNTEIRANARQVDSIPVSHELAASKVALLQSVGALLKSNERMQEELTCTRYRLEEQAQQIDVARQEARRDELTELANRRALNEKLHLLLDGWRRLAEPFVLILVDIDQFKMINDAHGHSVGDYVLQATGKRLKELLREGDFVGRFGGDEFAILLPNTAPEAGIEIADRIRNGIAAEVFGVACQDGGLSISVSMGVAVPSPDASDESILQQADQAMYRSKHAGRNKVMAFEPESHTQPA